MKESTSCNGSFSLGNACGHCDACQAALKSAAKKSVKKSYTGTICRGCYALDSACGSCEKCKDELKALSDFQKRRATT